MVFFPLVPVRRCFFDKTRRRGGVLDKTRINTFVVSSLCREAVAKAFLEILTEKAVESSCITLPFCFELNVLPVQTR